MIKHLVAWLGVLNTVCASISADDVKPIGQINDNLRLMGEIQARYEAWNFFRPEPAINNNNDYDYGAIRARLGILLSSAFADVFAQAQYSGIYGLPTNSIAVPGGGLGLGASYYADNRESSPNNVFLKQAYVNFKLKSLELPNLFLKAGRFELLEGMEYKTGEAIFDGLKLTRVSQRLVGPFGFTHITRSFDGFSLVYDPSWVNLTISGVRPTQGGFNIQGQDQISHVELFYSALTSKKGSLLPGTEARLFYIHYGDDRNTQVVDNRTLADRPYLNKQNLSIHTIGGHLLTLQEGKAEKLDGLLWGAYQFGDWTGQLHQAWAVAAEAGYQWPESFLKPWLRIGFLKSSGDDNSADNKHQTFYQMLPTVRAYAKFPFFNMMNIQDVFVQLIVMPINSLRITTDLHQLNLTASSDLFYAGAGATSRSGTFGFQGRPSGGKTDVGQLLDISITHTLSKELSWSLYYGHAFGGDVIQSIYKGQQNADFGFVELNFAF